jgi:hypothetical protein
MKAKNFAELCSFGLQGSNAVRTYRWVTTYRGNVLFSFSALNVEMVSFSATSATNKA